MAEQQLTQEQLGQEQLDGFQQPGPVPKVTPAPAIVPQQPKFGDISAITDIGKPKKQEQVLPTKKEKKLDVGNLSGAEKTFEQHALIAKASKISKGDITPGSILETAALVGLETFNTAEESARVKEELRINEQKALIQKNNVIKGFVENKVADKISDYLFGDFNDIVKFGGNVEKYIKKNSAGVEYIDEGMLRKDMDEAISAQGINAGRYLKEYLWSQVGSKPKLDYILSTFQGRDDIAKKMPSGDTTAQQKAFLLGKQTDIKNRFKGQIEAEERILQEKVKKIQQKYSAAITDASVDANFYWAAAQDKAMKQLQGVTGVYQPALQQSFERRAKEIFDTEYAQFVSPKYSQIADSIAADIKIEVSKTNDAVKRINKEINTAFKAEAETYLKGQNQALLDQFTKDIGSIIDSKTNARQEQNKGYAQSLIDMSGMGGMVGTTAIGKIFTETGMSALGSLKSKTALVLNALGLEADAIDAMKYSGKTAELNYSIEKLPLGENWFKPGYWAQSIAQSTPSMAAGMLTTALTQNPYIGGIVAFGSESIENSGGVMERVLENTGDMEAARAAGQESFIKNFPTVLSEVLVQRMFAPLSMLKAAKSPVTQRLGQIGTGVASNALEERWQASTDLSTGEGSNLRFWEAFFSKKTNEATIEGGAVGGIFGGASLATSASYKALFDKKNIPSVRTQSVAATILNNGETAAMAGVQLDAIANDMDEITLGEGMKEVQTVAKTIEEAKQIGLNPQQTQVFASLSQEVAELKNTLNNVTDPSARKAVEKQIASKEKEIEGVVNGTTPLATIEIQPGVVFTSTPDGVKTVMNTPEIKEEVAAGNVKIYTDDAGLNAEVDKVKAEAPARQRNIISDTGEIIGQVPTEAAPVTETTPITQTQIPQDATQISERPQQEVGQPSDIVQREGTQEGQPQERQAEGSVGETAQPSTDTRNRDFGSQAQQAVQEITALPEQTPAIQKYTRTINPGQEVQLMDELAQQVTEGEDRAVKQLGQPVVDKVRQWIADTGYTAPAVPAATMVEAAPVAEAAPVNVDELLTADTKEPTNLEKVFNFLDGIDKAIGKELNSGKLSDATRVIPLAAIQTMVKALKALVQGGMALQDAIRKVAADNNYTEKDVTDAMKKVAEIEKVGVMAGMTDEQIKERKKQERLGKVYNTPQAQQLIETAKQDAASAKTAKLTPTKAYEAVLAKVKEGIDKIYSSGNYPDGVAWINMMQVAPAIARDAVNAAFPRAKKLSSMETEMVTMSAREYMSSLVSSQIRGIGQLSNNSKKMVASLRDMFKAMNDAFGRGMELTPNEVNKIVGEIQSVVFDKSPDLQASMDEASREISAIVEKGYRRKMIDDMGRLIDKIKSKAKTEYTGDLIPKIANILSISPNDWDRSNATLEELSLFNTHLRQIAKGDNTKIDAALNVLDTITSPNTQAPKTEFDKLNTTLTNLNKKVKTGALDLSDLKSLMRLQSAMDNIAEKKSMANAFTPEQQTQLQQKYDELRAALPKPIDEMVSDKIQDVRGGLSNRIAQMKKELASPVVTAQGQQVPEGAEEIGKPTLEEQVRDMQAGNIVTFTYDNESQVPDVFKDKISSRGETDGKPFVRVSVSKLLADYELGRGTVTEAAPVSNLRNKIKSTDLYNQFLRMLNHYLTDNYLNYLAENKPSKLLSLNNALDDIYNDGNYNYDAYKEYISAIKYKIETVTSEWAKNLSEKRDKFSSSGLVNALRETARLLTDVEGGSVSPEAIKNNLATLRIHQLDVELAGIEKDEFDMGMLERDIFGPMSGHQEAAMNKTQPKLEQLRSAMLAFADNSNHKAIKKAIAAVSSKYGAGLDLLFAKLKELTKRGYQTKLLHDISVRMTTIIANQIDDISNLAEGETPIDVVLQRNIIGVKTDENGRPIFSDKTMAEHYKSPGTYKADVEQNYDNLVNTIAYAALTNNGTTTLAELSEDDLMALLSPKQKEGLNIWRQVINETEGLTEAAMVISGNLKGFLKNYFPRRVRQGKAVTEITDTENYLNGGFEYGGLANGMLQSRRGNVGALDLDGNRVLFNNIKSLYLLAEVKPYLDYIKGINEAAKKAEADGDLFAARYLQGVELYATERLNANLLKNEKSLSDSYGTMFKALSGIQSFTAKSYLISVIRQFALEYPVNILKTASALASANREMPGQTWRLLDPRNLAYRTPKGKFEWKDYMKVVQFTGSQIARTMNLYPDNYIYEYSKSTEQLQREQKLIGWQDIRPKKLAWMIRFETAFKRLTGEDFDHKAFEDERGIYRALNLATVEKASSVADSFVDKQYGLSSFTRDPLRINPGMVPTIGIVAGTLIGGPVGTAVAVGTGATGGFLSRGVRNLLNRIFKTDRAWFTIKKDDVTALVTGFLQGYAGIQHSAFMSNIKEAFSLNSRLSFKDRAIKLNSAVFEQLIPIIQYTLTRKYTGLLFVTATAVIMSAGEDEDKEDVRKNALNPDFWKRQLYKMRQMFKEQKDNIYRDLTGAALSVSLDPQTSYTIKMAAGFALFNLWKEDAVAKLAEKGLTKKEIEERKRKIKEVESVWFDVYNIRPIDIIHGEDYATALDRHYYTGEATKDWEETAATITASSELVQLVSFAKTWEELRKEAVENKEIDKDELYTAAALKAYSIIFNLKILGGKYGYALSMMTGDARKWSNMMLKDIEAKQRQFERENKSKKGGGAMEGGGLKSQGLGGGGLKSEGLK